MPVRAKSNQEILKNLLAKATRTESGCLICHIKPNRKGYSNLTVGGRSGDGWRAHRFVWHMLKGPIPTHLQVCHSCDIRNCIEIEHLFLGTGLDNSQDMVAKNRVARLGSPPVHKSILEKTVRLVEAGFSYAEAAEKLGLSSPSSVMYRIRKYYAEKQ